MFLFLRAEKLGPHLAGLKELMDRYQRGDPKFAADALAWLSAAEKLLAELRLLDASEIAILRGRVVRTAEEGGEGRSRGALRRAQNIAAADALERAEALMRQRIAEAEDRLERFEEKLAEGVTTATMAGAIPPRGGSWMDWLGQVWQGLIQCPNTRALTVYLSASLAAPDRLFILDRVLSRLTDTRNTVS